MNKSENMQHNSYMAVEQDNTKFQMGRGGYSFLCIDSQRYLNGENEPAL